MSILTHESIESAMQREDLGKRLIITPLLSPKKQVTEASVDVRLGNEFILTRKRTFPSLDIAERERVRSRIGVYQERVRIEFHEQFVLHPHQLVLGSTLEYLKLPDDMGAYLTGRSSWGRLGLVIETAAFIAPHFRGCVTLELVNVGEVPLILYPGVRIAQIVFHTTQGEANYHGRYVCPTGPQFSRVHEDEDIGFWCPSQVSPERSDEGSAIPAVSPKGSEAAGESKSPGAS